MIEISVDYAIIFLCYAFMFGFLIGGGLAFYLAYKEA